MGLLKPGQPLLATRPYRAPHHTISDAGLVGGGSVPAPGEISLSHNGVLFLDELPEFNRCTLEVLRQPLEEGTVTISRALSSTMFPARFVLVSGRRCQLEPTSGREYGVGPVGAKSRREPAIGPHDRGPGDHLRPLAGARNGSQQLGHASPHAVGVRDKADGHFHSPSMAV